jgi:GNAT superfamily N-acetyltransferase
MIRTQNSGASGRVHDRAAAVIRPVGPADRAALTDFFAGLSVQTRYLRFFGPVAPTPALLDLLCGEPAGVHVLVAVADGAIVGHALAADRLVPEGGQGRTTDLGVVVADAWQGRGLGSALMRAVVGQAQARGVVSLAMDVLHVNRKMLGMILRRWPAACTDYSRDSLAIRVRLAPPQPAQPPQPARPARPSAPPASRHVRPLVSVGS